MPETRIERAVFAIGILAIAALGFLVAHLWHHTRGAVAAPSRSLSPPALTTSTVKPSETQATTAPAHSTTHAPATNSAKTPATPSRVSLRITARSDTWLELRTTSSTGSLRYSGTLAAGSTKLFHARVFWARFGAAGNVLVRLDGKPIRLPSGTYDATFDGRGFRRIGA